MKQVEIYTDGACSVNPGPGGWAAILLYDEHEKEISGYEEETTNNRMELMAVIRGIGGLNQPCKINLYSDSTYVVHAFLMHWIDGWQKNNWMRRNEPVKNTDLWKELLAVCAPHQITWIKVAGHSDNVYNNRCDKLAKEAITANRKGQKEKQADTEI